MKLLPFGRADKPAEPPSISTTQGAIVLVDDLDLTRYHNNYQLYDTGPSTGTRPIVLDQPSNKSRAPPPPLKTKPNAFPHSDPVVMLDGSGTNFFDTPIISESEDALAMSVYDPHRKHSVNSIDILPLPHNAIRTGGTPKLFGTQYSGLLVNWLILGFMEGGTQTLIKPLFAHYLRMHRFKLNAVTALLHFAWFFKIFAAFITDVCPISHQRRKPYIYLGWTLVIVCMLLLVCLPGVTPFLSSDGDITNQDASSQGFLYVPFLVVAAFGQLWVTVACEGIVVELAQREGEFIRGRTQCIVVISHLVGRFVGTIVVALGFNNIQYGGDFGTAMPLQLLFGLFGLPAMIGIILTWFVIVDEVNVPPAQPIKDQLRRVGRITQRRPVWKLMIVGFLCTSALACDIVESPDVYKAWLTKRPLSLNLSTAATLLSAAMATFLVSRVWINTNWRMLLFGSLALMVIISIPIELMTFFNVCRNFVLYATKDFFVSGFDIVIRLIQLFIIVEVAEPGFEAFTYALATTAFNLGSPFVSIMTNLIASSGVKQDLDVDSANLRLHLTLEVVIVTAVRIVLVLVASTMLPRQKYHVKELNAKGTNGGIVAAVVLAGFLAVYLAVMTSSILTLSDTTSCLVFAGGNGCD